ncbi:MAG: hypothetical protein IKU94_10995 [Bacteroidaceae bacterium]|nr:hypothetical protein [Bacteroidaceae bacterium]
MGVTINDILYAVITVVVPLLLPFVFDLVRAKVADWRYAAALNDVFTAVAFVNQTFVDALKEKGCFDDEAQAHAFTKAKDAAMDLMAKSTRAWLEKSVTDLDSWLNMQIEAAVRKAKGAA